MDGFFRQGLEFIRKSGFLDFLRRTIPHVFRRLFRRILVLFIIFRLRGLVDSIGDVDVAVDFAYSFNPPGISISPSQVREEIVKLLNLFERLKPNVVAEIGTAEGGTLFLFTKFANPEATIISIDLPGGSFGGGYPSWKIPLYKSFAVDKQRIYLIRADSHDVDTIKKIEKILGGYEIDFLFIDGDHSYEGVKRDFEAYSPLVKKDGIIALHDIVPHDDVHDPSGTVEVDKFWSELKDRYKSLEIVKDWKQGWGGIGVLYMHEREKIPSNNNV